MEHRGPSSRPLRFRLVSISTEEGDSWLSYSPSSGTLSQRHETQVVRLCGSTEHLDVRPVRDPSETLPRPFRDPSEALPRPFRGPPPTLLPPLLPTLLFASLAAVSLRLGRQLGRLDAAYALHRPAGRPRPCSTTLHTSSDSTRLWPRSGGLIVLNNAAVGLCVSAVLKYADNLTKGFSTSASVLLASVASSVAFGFVPSRAFLLGAAFAFYLHPAPPF